MGRNVKVKETREAIKLMKKGIQFYTSLFMYTLET
eukprot:SAG22_NODE_3264_length_1822_cov_1.190946_1_plen_34_part_10